MPTLHYPRRIREGTVSITKTNVGSPSSKFAPVLVLFVLAPFIAEILLGATTLSHLESLVPVMMLYGGGVVMIRELARRRDCGWTRIIFLGVAYAIVEEGLVFQTLFNPDLFNAAAVGGRFLGVNWIFGEWVIGYHVVWSVLIPISLTELLFPVRQAEPWLGRTGTLVFGLVYVLGALAISFFIRSSIAPGFQASPAYVVGEVVLIGGLAAMGIRLDAPPARPSRLEIGRQPPAPWVLGLTALLAACLWFVMLHLPTPLRHGAWVLLPIVSGFAFVIALLVLIRQWSALGSLWKDDHRLALIAGAILANMLNGFFIVTANNRVDQLGQGVASVMAIAVLAVAVWRIRQKEYER
jgi:hypothetical protein